MSCSFGTTLPLRSVEEYFGSMNSTSKRLMEDVSGVKSAYESVWKDLDNKERENILNESIVPPEVSLHYGESSEQENQGSVYPRYKLKTGQKTLRVEMEGENSEPTSYSYLDEHSAPFHWKTRSTQELRFESGRPVSIASNELTLNGLEKITSPPSRILSTSQRLAPRNHTRGNPSFAKPVGIPMVPPSPSSISSTRLSSSPESVKSSQPLLKNTSSVDSLGPAHRIVKPRTAPPPPPPKRPLSAPPKEDKRVEEAPKDNAATPLDDNFKNFSINLSTDSIEIPKTGFDFLDNW